MIVAKIILGLHQMSLKIKSIQIQKLFYIFYSTCEKNDINKNGWQYFDMQDICKKKSCYHQKYLCPRITSQTFIS